MLRGELGLAMKSLGCKSIESEAGGEAGVRREGGEQATQGKVVT